MSEIDHKTINKILSVVLGFMFTGWMSWVSWVALEAGNKKAWMIKQQQQIEELQKIVWKNHGHE